MKDRYMTVNKEEFNKIKLKHNLKLKSCNKYTDNTEFCSYINNDNKVVAYNGYYDGPNEYQILITLVNPVQVIQHYESLLEGKDEEIKHKEWIIKQCTDKIRDLFIYKALPIKEKILIDKQENKINKKKPKVTFIYDDGITSDYTYNDIDVINQYNNIIRDIFKDEYLFNMQNNRR